ncbi:MAG: arylsulfatase [Planctomycetes bacterium]|nr:arylsulfatase [Planctomycetota bacterium]
MTAVLTGQQPAPGAAPKRPNVLLILADDLGFSDLGCYGGEIPTPNLDALAGNGVRFTQCYTSARCCPTRASLLTGLHPHQAGIGSFTTDKPDTRRGPAYLGHLTEHSATLAEVLRAAGYGTYMVGKWHVGLPGPIARGFDEFYGFRRGYEQDQWDPQRYERLPAGRELEIEVGDDFYATDAFTEMALQFLDRAQQQDRPWFLYVAHSAPHFPVQAPKADVDALVDTYRRGWDVLREERFARMQQSGLATEAFTLTERSLVPVDDDALTNGYGGKPNPAWAELPDARREDLARRMAVFAAMVVHVDRSVGKLVARLRETGQLDDTVVLFLSDNGACYEWGPFGFDGPSRRGVTTLHEGDALATMGQKGTYHAYGSAWANLCNTPFRLYKHFTTEGGIASPLIVHWPKGIVGADRWARDPVHVMDVLPTLCELCGADYPSERAGVAVTPLPGTSLGPVLRGEALAERTICFEHQAARAARRGRWKAVWGKRMPEAPHWELYDLATDRCETRDVAAEHPERTAELAAAWQRWADEVGVRD